MPGEVSCLPDPVHGAERAGRGIHRRTGGDCVNKNPASCTKRMVKPYLTSIASPVSPFIIIPTILLCSLFERGAMTTNHSFTPNLLIRRNPHFLPENDVPG